MKKFVIREYIISSYGIFWVSITIIYLFLISFWGRTISDINHAVSLLGIPVLYTKGYSISWTFILFYIILIESIVILPKPFVDMIDKRRIGLILSKPISRNKFIFDNIFGVFICISIYSIITFVLFQTIMFLKFEYWSIGFLYSSILNVLLLTGIYIISLFILLFLKSYSANTFLLFIYCFLLSPFLAERQNILSSLGLNSNLIRNSISTIFYISPRVSEIINFMNKGLTDFSLFKLICIVLSFVPISILLLITVNRREF